MIKRNINIELQNKVQTSSKVSCGSCFVFAKGQKPSKKTPFNQPYLSYLFIGCYKTYKKEIEGEGGRERQRDRER